MISNPRTRPLLLLALLGLFAFGCDDDKSPAAPLPPANPPSGAMPDFDIPDVNPNSATFGAEISPRDHLTRISAWYFGQAT